MLPFDAMRGDSGKVNVLRVEIIGNCEEKCFVRACVSSAWLPRLSLLNLQNQLDYIFICGFGLRAKFTKESLTHETNCLLAFGMMLPE
jgi:hypothetical protein